MLLPPYSYQNASLGDCLLDLSVRFVVNCPPEDLSTAERLFFQVEEAHWFYEDFVRLDNSQFPSMKLRTFVDRLFNACPFLLQYQSNPLEAFNSFQSYKSVIPVRGGIILNAEMTKVLMVKGWKSGSTWGFPKGKINKDESDSACAIREVEEECGFDMTPYLVESDYLEVTRQGKNIRLYVIRGVPEDTVFETQTRKEISKISWHTLNKLPFFNRKNQNSQNSNDTKYYMAAPFVPGLKKYINKSKGLATSLTSTQTQALQNVLGSEFQNDEDAASRLLGLLKPAGQQPVAQSTACSDTAILLNLIKSDHKATDLESAQQVIGLFAQQSDVVPSVEPTKIVLPKQYSSIDSPALPTPPLPPNSILQDLVSSRHNTHKGAGLLSILNGKPTQQPKPSNDLLSLLQPETPAASAPVPQAISSGTKVEPSPLKPQTQDLISLLSKPADPASAGASTPAPAPTSVVSTELNDLMSLLSPVEITGKSHAHIDSAKGEKSLPSSAAAGGAANSLMDLLNPSAVQENPVGPTESEIKASINQVLAERPSTKDLGVADTHVHLLDLLNKSPNKDPYPSQAVLLEYLDRVIRI